MGGLLVDLKDEAATRRLGADLAMALRGGMLVGLAGDLGAGKTTLARSLIRTLAGDDLLEVASPTFSLVLEYEMPQTAPLQRILHADLYRISSPDEVVELGIEPVDGTLVLAEWPERMEASGLAPGLTITLEDKGDGRVALIAGAQEALDAVARSLTIRAFLDRQWGPNASRSHLQGDASTRAYETVRLEGEDRILMNAPARPDGPAVRNGLPYSRIAHLAEDVVPFVAVGGALSAYGLSAPRIHASDLASGLLLIEDLGRGKVTDGQGLPIPERYLAACEALAHLHSQPFTRSLPVAGGPDYLLPAYDRGAMMIEAELLTDWYLPRRLGRQVTEGERADFTGIWEGLISRLAESEQHMVLRDYHSPNLIWLEARSGFNRVGIIDFQDALAGPCAYDLASLGQDARTVVDPALEGMLIEHYCKASRRRAGFGETAFREQYAIMAAQRATKILGIFVRLDERDGKPGYLRLLPQLETYLLRNLEHPALSQYRQWWLAMTGMASSMAEGGGE